MPPKSHTTKTKVLAAAFLCLLFLSASGDSSKPITAPMNPEFLHYLRQIETGDVPLVTDDGYGLGEIPPPVDLSHVRNVPLERGLDAFPATYDLRPLNKLSDIKNQGGCGSCWTFGAYASLESYGKPMNAWNFAEQDLNANHGFDYAACAGGNHFMSTAYLARWDGPLAESDVPYPYGDGLEAGAQAFSPPKHVQQIVFLPNRSGSLDNDTIKYFVTTYGAVNVSYYHSSTYMDVTDTNYYCSTTSNTNHSVAVVGWDDNYDKNNFKTVPPGNGAFIIRNSWGAGRHDNGYFYISYYDTSFKPRACFNNAEPPADYERIYQYDPLGWVTSYGYGSTTAWGANVFTAADNRPVRAVSFYTTDSNVTYTIYVYKGVSGSNPRSGTLAASQGSTLTYPGYYTVKLNTPVTVNNGDRFSVVIRFVNSGYNYPVAVEYAAGGYSSAATAGSGQSYISSSGSGWYDMSADGYNACIKAFAATLSSYRPEPDFNGDGHTDILWRYYATGGYNAVWLRGSTVTAPAGASLFGRLTRLPSFPATMDDQSYAGNVGDFEANDIDPFAHIERRDDILDGFAAHDMIAQIPARSRQDPFAEWDAQTDRLAGITAASVNDPRDAPEAMNLPSEANTFWRLSGTGDFNSDEKVDLVWRNLSTGQNAVWLMDGISRISVAALRTAADLNWMLCGMGDFNSDGNVDLVWRNMNDGRNAVWFMNGTTMTGASLLPSATNLNWWLCGTGDFNSDGKVDLVWRNMNDGRNAVWFMNGITMTGVSLLSSATNLNWVICGTGDFDRDRDVDLLWRNISDGRNAVWYMDGVTLTSVEMLTTVTVTDWMIEN
jgi:C1A family cysteine protease